MKNKLINYFFEDEAEFEAYKPYLFLLGASALFYIIVNLLCLL